MNERTRVAVAQMTSSDELRGNLAEARELVRRAAGEGARLIVLPENVAMFGREAAKLAVAERFEPGVAPEGPIGEAMREASRETNAWVVWGGVPERHDGARVFNACVAVSPDGEVAARYRKVHLFDVSLADGSVYDESSSVAPGEDTVVVDTGAGRLGLSVCYDLRFPELYRALVDQGAELLCVPAAFTVPTGRDHWHVLLRARAIESQCYVLAAAQWGAHTNGRETYGHAMVVDPWGAVLSELPEGRGVITAEVDPERLAQVRANLPSLRHRRIGR